MDNREKSELVRADILRILWARADSSQVLKSTDLKENEFGEFLVSSAQWLEREGLVYLGRCHEYGSGEPGYFSNASLTLKGETFLQQKLQGTTQNRGNWLIEAFQDAIKDGTKDALKQIPQLLWASYEAWK